jgi:molybdenum cofactor biosynthesis enzyme MoaA
MKMKLLEFVRLACSRGLIVRFIECMPMADVGLWIRDICVHG